MFASNVADRWIVNARQSRRFRMIGSGARLTVKLRRHSAVSGFTHMAGPGGISAWGEGRGRVRARGRDRYESITGGKRMVLRKPCEADARYIFEAYTQDAVVPRYMT